VGTPPGYTHSEETKEKIRQAKLGDKNPNWKGDQANQQTGRWRAEQKFPKQPCFTM
jgi:hypothetical protein